MQVWLQMDPAKCDVPMVIDLLYLEYGHHPSVAHDIWRAE